MDREKQDNEDAELIDMKEAIGILNTTRSTFYRWLREGKMKGMKIGRQWRFYREDIDRFLKGQEPQIDLPADINPLIKILRERVGKPFAAEKTESDKMPVVEAVDLMISLADRMNASDIHLAPHLMGSGEERKAALRYRVDGVLYTIAEIDTRLLPAIISRWKILAACDIHERLKPQDGGIRVRLSEENKELDLRVSFVPAALGEALTVRIIRSDWVAYLKLEGFGLSQRDREIILRYIKTSWGMIVVTGPIGSGKTTLLYSCLNHIARPEIKMMTAENPVEVLLPWAVQVSVDPDAGFTFPLALRSIMRSDPDVIMISEMRDRETLDIAHECSLTGHLVLTTMHISGAESVLKRMMEMGNDPYVISQSVKLIIATRLVRKLCPDCGTEQTLSAQLLQKVSEIAVKGGLDWDKLPKEFREPVGCEKCKDTGYRGRLMIVETLEVTPEICAAISRNAPVEEIRAIAIKQGMTSIAADGIRRAAMGETSLAEVMRVTGSSA